MGFSLCILQTTNWPDGRFRCVIELHAPISGIHRRHVCVNPWTCCSALLLRLARLPGGMRTSSWSTCTGTAWTCQAWWHTSKPPSSKWKVSAPGLGWRGSGQRMLGRLLQGLVSSFKKIFGVFIFVSVMKVWYYIYRRLGRHRTKLHIVPLYITVF